MLQPGSQAEECTEAPLLYVRSASISFINLGQVYAVLSVDWRAGKERDLIVQRHRKVMTQAKLKVTYFLLNNGFKRIDVNCRKRVHLGLAVTYPLHVAAVHNDHDMVKLLLHFGADPYKKVQKLLKKVGGGLLESKWIQRPFRNPVPAGLEDFFAEVERDPVVQSLKRSREKYSDDARRDGLCEKGDVDDEYAHPRIEEEARISTTPSSVLSDTQPQLQAEPKSRPPEGVDFLEQLQQAKEEVETDFSLLDVEREFQKKYTDKARPLLCSACKIAAERIGLELDARNATVQPDPSTMLNATKEAVLAACQALPSPLVVVEGEGKASFEEVHDSDHRHLTGVELRRAEVAQRSVDRLCRVLLAEAKLDMLQLMMQHKVPHTRFHGQVLSDNWERWLCARRSRLCKYSEVIDDDEDEEGEL
ncbi:hypothetical protein AK812_SmicGene10103 [Symbiodinium microadriaticum]|uniref:Uncharacterized protein n=1 Tax=Symbiodinium microadriaticum TaxID=2951 RepID=A0A1Q9EGR6_SYMMI|nr:hypothetical protein AK812_SmicGene10103 [Symbiodinium microadriaticum]